MLDPSIAEQGNTADAWNSTGFTAHQIRVLSLLASGASNAEIAVQLKVSIKSVEHSITTINNALKIDSGNPKVNPRVSAAMAYMKLLSASQ
jgi:DNA-binding NarL/FixJ family response regulator